MRDDGDWREYLTKEERARIRAIDRELAKHEKRAAKLRKERSAIQNRATQRRRYSVRIRAQGER